MIWKPNVTVAAIAEQNREFLLVEEEGDEGLVLNQPAGHLEQHETLLNAVTRETLEETAWRFVLETLIGVYLWSRPGRDSTYLRFCFAGAVEDIDANRTQDTGILRAVWMRPDEIAATVDRHRSPQVQRCLDDYLAGQRFPLSILTQLAPV